MEFLNIGGGEILVIVLLAIILFGPEDILKIMRAIGNYTRKIQRMWAQMSAGLKGEFIPEGIIPEEVRQAIGETKASVDEVKTTLAEVQTTVQTDIDDTKATVKEVRQSLREVDTSVKSDMREIPKAMRAAAANAVTPKEETDATENEPGPETVHMITALLEDSSEHNNDEPVLETEVATAIDINEATPPNDADAAETESPRAKTGISGAETDQKTVALIASLLEGKSKDTGDGAKLQTELTIDESNTTPVEAEATEEIVDALFASDPSPMVVPESADVAPVAPPETLTAASTPQGEEM